VIANAMRRLAGLGAAMAGAVLVLGAAGQAQAMPDAKIDEQIRPNSGILLSPVVAPAAMALSSVSVVPTALRLRTIAL